jgi:hypothetical protein
VVRCSIFAIHFGRRWGVVFQEATVLRADIEGAKNFLKNFPSSFEFRKFILLTFASAYGGRESSLKLKWHKNKVIWEAETTIS